MNSIMKTLEVCCALIELSSSSGTLLLGAKKKHGKINGLLYEFPGGKIEPGESAKEAVIREIREELGCDITPVRMFSPVQHQGKECIIRLTSFLCKLEQALPLPLEHESLGFFSIQTLKNLPWAPADISVLNQWLDEREPVL